MYQLQDWKKFVIHWILHDNKTRVTAGNPKTIG